MEIHLGESGAKIFVKLSVFPLLVSLLRQIAPRLTVE
jgi:hypothetical protein